MVQLGIVRAHCMVQVHNLEEHVAQLLKRTDGLYLPPSGPVEQGVFKGGEYTFLYDYPLENEARFIETLPVDATYLDLMRLGLKHYRAIYAEEEATTPVLAQDSQQIGSLTLMNRTRTKGKYGIWGHVLNDLFFEGICIDMKQRVITFNIGS